MRKRRKERVYDPVFVLFYYVLLMESTASRSKEFAEYPSAELLFDGNCAEHCTSACSVIFDE